MHIFILFFFFFLNKSNQGSFQPRLENGLWCGGAEECLQGEDGRLSPRGLRPHSTDLAATGSSRRAIPGTAGC